MQQDKNINVSKSPHGGLGVLLLHLADSALIISQRQSEWCGHGPVLEQDIAITNISLDLLGQARLWYQYAASLYSPPLESLSRPIGGQGVLDEDKLAYFRNDREYKNFILCELPNGDWAQTILKLYFFSSYQQLLFNELKNSKDEQIAAIAEKSLKEINYHVRWSSEWVIRLGDGTEESKVRMEKAIEELWESIREFFEPTTYETEAAKANIYFDTTLLKENWLQQIKTVFEEAKLNTNLTINTGWTGLKGKEGIHTEHLGYILAEMQVVQRAYPNAEW